MKMVTLFFIVFAGGLYLQFKPATELLKEISVIDMARVTAPSLNFKLDLFYKKYIDTNGIPIISSWRVPDSAQRQAGKIVIFMTKV